MSVYAKLNQARIALQSKTLNKSGHNKFAGYRYFELGDFMPQINQIFSELQLSGVVSFGLDVATLTITDIEDSSQITITSPMRDANLKGAHPIQNLGAVETYTRRYLWVTAMEIVEHDALDSSKPVEDESKVKPPKESAKSIAKDTYDNMDEEQKQFIADQADIIKDDYELAGVEEATKRLYGSNFDQEEITALWYFFDSKMRSAIKKYREQTKQVS